MNDTSAGQPDQANGKVTAAQARAAIEVLLDAFQRFTDAGQWAVAPEHEHLATSVFGWWAWINRSSQLIVLGHNAGLGHETAPNARSVLEHTLVLQWVVDLGDEAMAAVAARADENRRKLYDDVQRAGWPIPEGITRPEPPTTHVAQQMLKFAPLCHAYDAGMLYIPFRTLSAHVHPSAKGAEAYLDLETGRLQTYAARSADSDLVLVAICLIWATETIDSFTIGHPLSAAITEAHHRLGQPIERPTLRPRDAGTTL